MSRRIINTRIIRGRRWIWIATDPLLTVYDIIDLLLAKDIDPDVRWTECADVGMGFFGPGESKGSEFRNPANQEKYYDYDYADYFEIAFEYEGDKMRIIRCDSVNKKAEKVTVICSCEWYDKHGGQMILKLLSE